MCVFNLLVIFIGCGLTKDQSGWRPMVCLLQWVFFLVPLKKVNPLLSPQAVHSKLEASLLSLRVEQGRDSLLLTNLFSCLCYSWLLNLFTNFVEGRIKDALNGKVCSLASSSIEGAIDSSLTSFPGKISSSRSEQQLPCILQCKGMLTSRKGTRNSWALTGVWEYIGTPHINIRPY